MADESKSAADSQLAQLSGMTIVVADTGDFGAIKAYKPTDATTNPSLIYKAAQMEEYAELVKSAVGDNAGNTDVDDETMALILDKLAVNFGKEILKVVPGYVSTEVDARLSFDTEASVKRARRIISMYEEAGVSRERVLIKLATTWEGCQAAEILEKEGIHCNMTLLFSFAQAVAAAQVGATLVSPFVGRILDWYKKSTGRDGYPAEEDPGVLSVRRIYNYYKAHGFETIVMGASFRNKGELLALAGCDRLTIAPSLLEALSASNEPVERKLTPEGAAEACTDAKTTVTEQQFRWQLNEDAMATEKLAEGIRNFAADLIKLEAFLKTKFFTASN